MTDGNIVSWSNQIRQHPTPQMYLLERTTALACVCVCVCMCKRLCAWVHLFIQSLVVFEQWLQSFEDLHFTGDSRRWGCLSLHHCHPQTAFVPRHQTLQVLQQQLQTHTQTQTHTYRHAQTKRMLISSLETLFVFISIAANTHSHMHTLKHTHVPWCCSFQPSAQIFLPLSLAAALGICSAPLSGWQTPKQHSQTQHEYRD